MATLLYRLGALAARRRLTFLATALVALASVLVLGFGLAGSFTPSDSIPGSAAQVALDKLDHHFPDSSDHATGDLVLEAPTGATFADPSAADDAAALVAPGSAAATGAACATSRATSTSR